MLNIFPIQFLAPLAYFLLRICVGIIFLRLGIKHLQHRNKKTLNMATRRGGVSLFVFVGILECMTGALFMLGAYTQVAALTALFLTGIQVLRSDLLSYHGYPPRVFFALLCVVALSLFITGAGVFAIDLPL